MAGMICIGPGAGSPAAPFEREPIRLYGVDLFITPVYNINKYKQIWRMVGVLRSTQRRKNICCKPTYN